MALSDLFLPEFEQEAASTRRLIERVPMDRADWQPHAKSMTLGKLANHVVEIPGWVKETLTMTVLDLNPPGGEAYAPTTLASTDELLAKFDQHIAQGRDLLAGASDDDWAVDWTMKAGEMEFFTIPRSAVMRTWVLNHLVHHRAQLGVYLRLLDIPVPGVYGPSADEGG